MPAAVAAAAVLAALPGGALAQDVGRVPGPAPAFGLAHVDVMDLHVERPPDGPPRDREILPAADLDDRFVQARAVARVDRWSLYWDLVERAPGTWSWDAADGMVARDVESGIATLMILQGVPPHHAAPSEAWLGPGLAPWPAWGRTGGAPSLFAPRGEQVAMAPPPRSLDAPAFLRRGGGLTDDPLEAAQPNPDNPWASFVARAVARYRPGGELARARGWAPGVGVRRWEIGNEPNLSFFWSGTPEQFARYLEVAYLVARFVDPEAIVAHGGIADDASAGPWFERFLDALAARAAVSPLPARHGWYFDASAWHWYSYPDLLRTGPAKARGLLAAEGLDKPIWVTELGVPVWSEHPGPCWDPRSPWRATAAEQSGYVWQAAAEAAFASVELLVLFQAYDDCGNGPASYDAFGLRRNHASNQCWADRPDACWQRDPALDGTARPAWHALEAAARELAGATPLWRPAREAAGWQRLLLYRPPDTRVMALWNHTRSAQAVEVFGTGPSARILSPGPDGRIAERVVAPVGGRLVVDLPPVTNLNNPGGGTVMAGHPILVVERDASPPFRAEVDPLPAESPPEIRLMLRAADGGTGIGRVQLLVAAGEAEPPTWMLAGGEEPWGADPLSGTVESVYVGLPGARYRFALRAADRAGNWTALPAAAQAETRVRSDAPSPSPPTAPTASATAPPPPTASATAPPPTDVTPGPAESPTPTPTRHVVARLHMPLVLARGTHVEEP